MQCLSSTSMTPLKMMPRGTDTVDKVGGNCRLMLFMLIKSVMDNGDVASSVF